MAENTRPFAQCDVTQIEPDARLVVLARTMQAQDVASEAALTHSVARRAGLVGPCFGQALYRHASVHQSASHAPIWSHLELSYFRDIVPVDVIHDLVFVPQPDDVRLLRAEVLLTTPSSFVMPRGWQGSAGRPELQASLEYIDVRPEYLSRYRETMRKYIGPAAAKSVGAARIGTFRAMETAAVLYHDPSLTIDWNQIHLCEVDPRSFEGFGHEFEAALRDISPEVAVADVFADFAHMRTITRWTFNEAVVDQLGAAEIEELFHGKTE